MTNKFKRKFPKMFDLLPKDIINEIGTHLCCLDQMRLKLVCRNTSTIRLDATPTILKKLSKHFPDPKAFLAKLKETNSIIAGSFILACINDTDDYDDIDVYENYPQNPMCITPFSDYMYSKYPYEKFPEHTYMSRPDTSKYDHYLRGESYIVRDFKIRGTKLQHIRIECPVLKFINASFDLDICKSCFDGERLYVRSWKKLLYKYDYIKPNGMLMEFYPHDVNENKVKGRREKYQRRGYKIEYHPRYAEILDYLSEIKYLHKHRLVRGVMRGDMYGWKTYTSSDNEEMDDTFEDLGKEHGYFKYGYELVKENAINLDQWFLE